MSHTRMSFLIEHGFDMKILEEFNIGPVVFYEHIDSGLATIVETHLGTILVWRYIVCTVEKVNAVIGICDVTIANGDIASNVPGAKEVPIQMPLICFKIYGPVGIFERAMDLIPTDIIP